MADAVATHDYPKHIGCGLLCRSRNVAQLSHTLTPSASRVSSCVVQELCTDLLADIRELHREAFDTFQRLVLPLSETHGFNQTLYGYMHRVFSYADLLSSYWRGSDTSQSIRMVEFMEKYFGPNRRAHSIAVQMWRHKLTHTARPRRLVDRATGKAVRYPIQWHGDQLPRHQPHFTIVPFGTNEEVLNVGCIPLIEDLERAAGTFVADVMGSALLQQKFAAFENALGNYQLRAI